MNEIWKDIEGFEGLYQVSNLGRVKSMNYNRTGKEKILKKSVTHGYERVVLYKDKKQYNKNVHRLVAGSFIDNPNNLESVNHINGIKTDNRAENLEWVTCKENNIHAVETGLRKCKKVKCIETGQTYISIHEAQRSVNGKISNNIKTCCNGRTKSAYGLHWCYIE